MGRRRLSDLRWDTFHRAEGGVLVAEFDGRPRHVAVIPFEVLEDGLQTNGDEPLDNATKNHSAVEQAIERALIGDSWRELVEVDTKQELVQLWVTRDHFGQ